MKASTFSKMFCVTIIAGLSIGLLVWNHEGKHSPPPPNVPSDDSSSRAEKSPVSDHSITNDPEHPHMSRLTWLLQNITPKNIRDVVAEIETLSKDPRIGRVWDKVIARWAEFDGPAAFTFAINHETARFSAIHAMERWWSLNPHAVETWLAQIQDPDQRAYQTRYLVAVWLRHDQNSALGSAALLEEPTMRSSALLQITQVLSSHPEGVSPEELAESLSRHCEDPSVIPALGFLAGHWAGTDAKAAAGWVIRLPQGPMRAEAMHNLIGSWGGVDPAAAGDWLNSQSPSSDFDKAIAAYARIANSEDPNAAISWLPHIQNPAFRQSLRDEFP